MGAINDNELREMSIKMRTPITEAAYILDELANIYMELHGKDDFVEIFFKKMWKDETTDGANMAEEFKRSWDENPGEIEINGGGACMFISCAYCVQAMREYKANDDQPTNLAWAYTLEANTWHHFLKNIVTSDKEMKEILSNRASQAAKARYAKDPKQKCIKEIEEKFIKDKGKFERRGYGAKFVKEMGEQYPEIESYKTIEKLVTKLKKKNQ